MHDAIDEAFSETFGVWHGGRPRTQILDITHALTLITEKALDMQGRLTIVRADVRQCYGSLFIPAILERLRLQKTAIGEAVVTHQLRTKIRVGYRGIGSLTGSRIAVALGRVPVAAAIQSATTQMRPLGFKLSADRILTACTYVDNIWTVAHESASAGSSI